MSELLQLIPEFKSWTDRLSDIEVSESEKDEIVREAIVFSAIVLYNINENLAAIRDTLAKKQEEK